MSKEKNLTYIAASGDPATKDVHEWVGVIHGPFYTGPAIDRLYEFEKLGMEPGEIKGRLEAAEEYIEDLKKENIKLKQEQIWMRDANATVKIRNGNLIKENEDLKKDLAWYKGQHGVLKVQHSNQAVTIRNLTEENDEMRKEIAEGERNEERLHAVIKNQNEYIEQLKAKFDPGLTCKQVISQQRERINELDRICGVQKDEIEFLTRREHILEGSVRQLNECINERDEEIKDLESIVKNQSIEISDLKGKLQDKRKQLDSYKAENSLMGELLKKHGIVILRGYVED